MLFKKLILITFAFLLFGMPVLSQEATGGEEIEGQIIAIVNGENLYMQDLEKRTNIQLITQQLSQIDQKFAQFLNYSEAGQEFLMEYNRYVLDDLIGEILLLQEAGRKGIEVTEEDEDYYFEQHINEIKEKNGLSEEEILEVLQQQQIESLEQYQEVFVSNSNLLVQKLMEEEGIYNIKISDEMASEVYEQNKEQFVDQSGSIPPFEDIKEQLKAQIMQQEEQNAVNELTEELRENAEIEKLL